jgi:hypothetical protein
MSDQLVSLAAEMILSHFSQILVNPLKYFRDISAGSVMRISGLRGSIAGRL